MKATRVLVANELRSYRETIARVITGLRPEVEVHEVEPEDLDAKVARLRPDLVICSRVTSTVESCVPVWAELYPDHKFYSRVGRQGETTTVNDMQLPDLLKLLDHMDGLPQMG
jgi:hypothetical protein